MMNLWGVKRNQQQSIKRAPQTMTPSVTSSKYLNYNYPTQAYRTQPYENAGEPIGYYQREMKSDFGKCLSSTNMNPPSPYNNYYHYYQDFSANPIKSNNENIFPSPSIDPTNSQFPSNYLNQQSQHLQYQQFPQQPIRFDKPVYNEPTPSTLHDSQLHKPQNLAFDMESTKSFNATCQQNKPPLDDEKLTPNYSFYSGGFDMAGKSPSNFVENSFVDDMRVRITNEDESSGARGQFNKSEVSISIKLGFYPGRSSTCWLFNLFFMTNDTHSSHLPFLILFPFCLYKNCRITVD